MKKLKRILFMLITLVAVVVLFVVFASTASAETYGELTYEVSNGEVTITGCDRVVTSVVIPSEINGQEVKHIGNAAFSYCEKLRIVVLPQTVTSIGMWAFGCCYELIDINLPDSIEYIGESAFSQCESLDSIILPNKLLTIEHGLFAGCANLNYIEIPDTVSRIGGQAFAGTAIIELFIPDSVTVIGMAAFEYCKELEKINIPKDIKTIPSNLFSYTEKLKTIVLPDNLETISPWAFQGCFGLETIDIPKNIKYIEVEAFSECFNLKKISFYGFAPDIDMLAFAGVSAVVSYPACDATWTQDKLKNYGGKLSWTGQVTQHQYLVDVIFPTCTEQGYTTYTCSCGDTYVDDYVDPIGHIIEVGCGKAPTCTEIGYTDSQVCVECGETLVAQKEIPATGHTPGSWEVVIEAQVGAEGKEQQKCTVCSEVLDERVIPALPDVSYMTGDANGDGKITAADARIALRISAKVDSLEKYNLTDAVLDVTGDGKLTAADARKILRIAAKIE